MITSVNKSNQEE